MLNHTRIMALKPKVKPYTVADYDSLCMLVKPNGKKVWWFRYRFAGKQKTYTIGEYPAIGLADARQKRDEAKGWLVKGHDPVVYRIQDRAKKTGTTFKAIAEAWIKTKQKKWAENTLSDKKKPIRESYLPFYRRNAHCRY